MAMNRGRACEAPCWPRSVSGADRRYKHSPTPPGTHPTTSARAKLPVTSPPSPRDRSVPPDFPPLYHPTPRPLAHRDLMIAA